MDKIKRIHFEDHGQDFLTFDVKADGTIVDVKPFQKSIWMQYRVANQRFRVGGLVHLHGLGDDMTIRYPIEKIETITADVAAN